MSEQAIQSLLRFFFGKIGAPSRRRSSLAAKGYISCRLPGCKRSRDGFGTLPTSCGLRRFEFLRENSKQPFSSSFQKNPEGFTFGILVICFSDVRTASSAGESKKAFASSIERSEKRTTTLRLSKSCRWNSNRLFTGRPHVMQETDYSVPLERLAGMKTFWREQFCPLLRTGMTQTAGGCCSISDRARKRDYEYGVS